MSEDSPFLPLWSVGVRKNTSESSATFPHFRYNSSGQMRWKEFPPRVPPHPHRDGATARTYNTPRTVIVWALSTSSLKHKAGLFRGNHSMAPCLGSPCLVSARTSRSPDKAAHSLDRWPDSLCNLSQLLACFRFSHTGSEVFLSGRGERLYWAGVCLVTDRHPLQGLLRQSQPTAKITVPSPWV